LDEISSAYHHEASQSVNNRKGEKIARAQAEEMILLFLFVFCFLFAASL